MKKMLGIGSVSMAAMMVFSCLMGVTLSSLEPEKASAATNAKPVVQDVDYEGKGVVDVEFRDDVKYKRAKVTVKDNKGKKYSAKVLHKDSDDIEFKIKRFKKGRTYKFVVKGVKNRGASGYKSVKDKVVVPKKGAAKSGRIGIDKAKAIALEDAGLSGKDVRFTELEFDYDDGFAVYEVDFVYGSTEYEYTIDAKSGAVLERDIESDEYEERKHRGGKTAKGLIKPEKAKEIALEDAGLKAGDVRFKKVKLDYEDGIRVYEVEFYHDYLEYEYDIDAKTGEILEADIDD